ncbi:MAG: carboxypeptidase regulatory-like domain-containing protein [Candidatus Aenigmarchaeota archaeon]|nr:carboxypeptidase regulatory-like domain-containing protein [Candidatus Aenigmarchaeota archaeon]
MDHGKWLLLLVFVIVSLSVPWPARSLTGSITTTYPGDGAWTNGTNDTLSFIFSYVDPHYKTASCSLFIDPPNASFASITAYNGTQHFMQSKEDFAEGQSSWRIQCINGTGIASGVRTFTADRDPPSVSLVSPANGASLGKGTITFTYIFSDRLSPQAYCTLHVDGLKSGASAINGTWRSSGMSLSPGNYGWHVGCRDNAGNTGLSGTYLLDVWELGAISIASPRNATYAYMDGIPLTFMLSGTPYWMGYSLDGSANVTISGNTTFDVDSEGTHSIELYARDTSGKYEYDIVRFTVRLSHGIDFVTPAGGLHRMSALHVNATTDLDADWCGISLDGGSNITMSEDPAGSWSQDLTGLSEGSHVLRVWCNDSSGFWSTNSTSFSVMLTGFGINPLTPANRSYWNTSSLDAVITLTRDAVMCRFYLDSEGPLVMVKDEPRRWHYGITSIAAGTYTFRVVCNDSAGFSDSATVVFTVKSQQCESDVLGICSGSQSCSGGRCVDLACGECAYASNHTCISHECCSDDECLATQRCSGNMCVGISCGCGEIKNHACMEYDCCSNFDCDANQRCDLATHSCVGKSLLVVAPESVVAGQVFDITVMNQEGGFMQGAEVIIDYPGGGTKTVMTDSGGLASAIALESGQIQITVTAEGYDPKVSMIESQAGIDWWVIIFIIALVLAGAGGYFYWMQLPPLALAKAVRGQNVTLRVKNRTPERIDNVLVVDSVPSGAFLGCNLNPRIENFGGEDHMTWFASLEPGEEIVIDYQASGTSESFIVRVGDEEYRSGYGLMGIVQEAWEMIERLLPKRKGGESAGGTPP